MKVYRVTYQEEPKFRALHKHYHGTYKTLEAAKAAAEKAHGSKIDWKLDSHHVNTYWSWADFYITEETLIE